MRAPWDRSGDLTGMERAAARYARAMTYAGYWTGIPLVHLVTEASGSAPNSFWGTLIATLVGATFAGAVSVALYRGEASSRLRGEIDRATVALIRSIQEHSDAYRHWKIEYEAFSVNAFQSIGRPTPIVAPPLPPDLSSIDTAAGALVVLTRGKDRAVASHAQMVLAGMGSLNDSSLLMRESAAVRSILVDWRARHRSSAETVSALEVMQARQVAFDAGAPEEQWPPIPTISRKGSR